jgi:hypothetical protein
MNTTKHESHGTVAGQVDCRVRPHAQEVERVLRELDDRTNQTWRGKRARWAELVRAQDAEIQRLRLLTFCGCGDQFTAHDPGTCGACVAGMTCAPGWNPGA